VTGRDTGDITLANGYSSHGEPVRRERDASGQVSAVWLAASEMSPEALVVADMTKRYRPRRPRAAPARV